MNKKIAKTLLFFTLFFLQAYLIRFSIGPYPSNLLEPLIGLTLIFYILSSFGEKIKIKNFFILIIFIALSIFSSFVVNIFDTQSLVRYWKFLIFASLLVFLFLEILKEEKDREKGLFLSALGASVFGIFCILYNLFGYNNTFDYRLLGPLDAAVYLAFYLAPFFIFSAIKFIENTQKFRLKNIVKNKYFLSALSLGILLLLTRSMGAIAGSFLIISLYLFKKFGKNLLNSLPKKIIFAVLIALISFGIFYTKVLPALTTTWSSMNERKEIWLTSEYLIKDNPKTILLGLGFGQFQHHYAKTVQTAINNMPLDFFVLQPHNIFLLFWFNFGLLGLLFLIFLIFSNIKTLHTSKKIDLKTISAFIVLYFFIHGLIDTPFFKNDILFLLLLFLQISHNSSSGTTRKIK